MALTTEKKAEILKEYGLHETDTGSPEAQVALLTSRINTLTEHLKFHKHLSLIHISEPTRPTPVPRKRRLRC